MILSKTFTCFWGVPIRKQTKILELGRELSGESGPILCEIENADRKRKTAFFDLDFSIRKKYIAFLKIRWLFFLIEKSRSKNAVFRFQSALFSISHKIANTRNYVLLWLCWGMIGGCAW